MTDLSVDLATQGIYATVSGGNGLSTQQVGMWFAARLQRQAVREQ